MKKIVYDYQVFHNQKFGGISRYFYELMKHSNGLFNYSVGGIFSDNYYANELGFHKWFTIKKDFRGKWRLQNKLNTWQKLLNNYDTTRKLRKDCDAYHPTYYDHRLVTETNKPIVLTVYDMIYELAPNGFPADHSIISQQKTMISNATKIIAISQNTKKDILKFYPHIPEDSISVVYLGTSWDILNNEKRVNSKYVLFTGHRTFYKNFYNFIFAIAPLLKKYDLQLKCTGNPFTDAEIDLLKQQNISDRTSAQFANEDELKDLYANAHCFVFPSTYEGFGIPILEAFACGCPLVLSETSCFPEIAGDAGIYFDPNSIENMREKIDAVICSETLRKGLVNKGFERLKAFSWRKCAEQTAEVYEKCNQ